jgi:2-oxoglutarate ferredoxin oxidoreductase subunit alpha
LIFAHFIGHGDTQIVLLMPGSINECFEFGWRAFDLAEKLQTPIIVLSDLDFGMNQWMAKPFEYPDIPIDRGKVLWEADLERLKGDWVRYKDVDRDFIPYRTLPGNQHPRAAYFARGSGHDENGLYSEDPIDWHNLLERLKNKFESARTVVPDPVIDIQPGAEIGILAFGSTESAIKEARYQFTNKNIKTDFMRLRAVPFSRKVGEFLNNHRRNYIVEMNRDGQLYKLLTLDFQARALSMVSIAYTDGLPLTAERVYQSIIDQEERYHE